MVKVAPVPRPYNKNLTIFDTVVFSSQKEETSYSNNIKIIKEMDNLNNTCKKVCITHFFLKQYIEQMSCFNLYLQVLT